MTTYNVTNETDLNNAIGSIDAAGGAGGTIQIANSFTLTADPLVLSQSATIIGNSYTIDGGGLFRGLMVLGGSVTIQGLAIDNALAIMNSVRQIVMREGRRLRMIEAADTALDNGFHLFEPENAFRWTDGDALVPAVMFADVYGVCEVELHVSCTARYIADAAAA